MNGIIPSRVSCPPVVQANKGMLLATTITAGARSHMPCDNSIACLAIVECACASLIDPMPTIVRFPSVEGWRKRHDLLAASARDPANTCLIILLCTGMTWQRIGKKGREGLRRGHQGGSGIARLAARTGEP